MQTKQAQALKKIVVLLSLALVFFLRPLQAGLEEDIEKIKPRVYCINAGLEIAWQETLSQLEQLEIPLSLIDPDYHLLTTEFIQADSKRLRDIAKSPKPFLKGRFSLKLKFKNLSSSSTQLEIFTQIRQGKMFGKKEKMLKSSGKFERFLAFRISSQAVSKQYPWLADLRLGMDFIPDIEKERYQIRYIEENSPAREAGFKEGDLLLKINAREITIHGELFDALKPQESERKIEMEILRGSKPLVIPVSVFKVKLKDLGMILHFDASKKRMGIKTVKGSTPAFQAGLESGDQLLSLQGRPLESWTDYYRALASVGDASEIQLEIMRREKRMTVRMPLMLKPAPSEVSHDGY